MTVQTVAPVRKRITVEAPRDRAFDVFTARMVDWWNPDFHIGEEPFAEIVVQPTVGGSWHEVDAQGRTCRWGTVLVWEPPARVVLNWQLDATWQYDPDLVTELELTFTELTPTSTLVELEHRGLERMGDRAAQTRAALDDANGWAGLLERFAARTRQ